MPQIRKAKLGHFRLRPLPMNLILFEVAIPWSPRRGVGAPGGGINTNKCNNIGIVCFGRYGICGTRDVFDDYNSSFNLLHGSSNNLLVPPIKPSDDLCPIGRINDSYILNSIRTSPTYFNFYKCVVFRQQQFNTIVSGSCL